MAIWNQTAMLKNIWSHFAQAGSLLITWVEKNWFKSKSFWQISIPNSCSWSWKQLLKLRDVAKKFLSFKVGEGTLIFMWLDCWHSYGYLLDRYGFRPVYEAGSCVDAKLSSIIQGGEWFWPYAHSDLLVHIQGQLSSVNIGVKDLAIWKAKKGVYNCAETWDALREKENVVERWKIVWFSVAIPRHSFLLWLVFRDALITKEKMCK
jgi:hypothetical protein